MPDGPLSFGVTDPPIARLLTDAMKTQARYVLLADRHVLLAEGVRGLLETMFDAVVMVADAPSLLETAGRLHPTVCVVDISLAGTNTLEWVGRLRQCCPETRLVLLSVHDEPQVLRAAKAEGADAVVLKREIATQLLPTLEQVLGEAGAATPGPR